MYPTIDPNTNSIDPITNTDPAATSPSDPTTTMPATNAATDTTGDTGAYTSSYPMPPSPTAEPFIPALSVPATTDTPRDRAYTLHLQGYRSPAIAAHLHVPERTIRHWIQTTNKDLNALPALDALDDPAALPDATDPNQQTTASTDTTASTPSTLTTLQHQRTLAVERHRARAAAAWALHDQLRATLDPFLARLSERLLLHTQYPDDNDHVSMSTLALAGGPLSPAFRAMYHMLPGIITGLTRSLALAERADLQIDRLLAVTPPPAPKQSPAPKAAPTPPTQQEPSTPRPTSEDFIRAAHAQRIAEEDAYVIPRLTQHERDLIRLYCALPDPLPDGPMETWNIKVDHNAPLTRWREVLLPHRRHLDDDDDPCDPEGDLDDANDPDDDPDPTPPSGKGGNHSGNATGKKIGNPSGNAITTHTPPPSPHGPFPPRERLRERRQEREATERERSSRRVQRGGRGLGKTGNPSGKRSTSPRPHHRASNRPRTTSAGKEAGKDARTDAPTTSGNHSGNVGNKIGNDSGNHPGNANDTIPGNDSGNKIGNDSGNPTAHQPAPAAPDPNLRDWLPGSG